MRALVSRFIQDESGQALVEYGAVVGLIVAGAVVVMLAFRTQIQGLFNSIAAQFTQIPQ